MRRFIWTTVKRGTGSVCPHRSPPATPRGFTLLEMVITLTITGILTALAIGGMQGIVRENTQTTAMNQLVTQLVNARSEATKRRAQVVLCPSIDKSNCVAQAVGSNFNWWQTGMIAFPDNNNNEVRDAFEAIIQNHTFPDGLTIKTSTGSGRIAFTSDGLSQFSNASFTFCDSRGTSKARYVILSNTGRTRVSRTPPDGTADAPNEICS